tara:strand:+ start:454 stop:870 length:417 start_codon:yes stop_codon:yes gene_type:complete
MELQESDSFDPKECISGKMMRLNRVTANVFRKYLSPFGITDSQLTILFILSKKSGLNQKQLSDLTVLEKSTLNRNLNRLIGSELISKADFPLIKITIKGKTLVNAILPEWKKAMNEIERMLESDGKNALDTLMKKLLK